MREVCYCGRSGEIESREPFLDGNGKRALRYPDCGHDDYLDWFAEDARRLLLKKAEGKQALTK